jgi:hypothetical protein
VREHAVAVVVAMSIAKTDSDDAELPAPSRPLSALPLGSPPDPPPDRGRALTRAIYRERASAIQLIGAVGAIAGLSLIIAGARQ